MKQFKSILLIVGALMFAAALFLAHTISKETIRPIVGQTIIQPLLPKQPSLLLKEIADPAFTFLLLMPMSLLCGLIFGYFVTIHQII